MIQCTARFRLLNVGSSGLRRWCWHRSPRLGAGLTWRPPRPAAFVVVREYDSAFRVWRILGGGKIRQTLCVLNLAKILLNNSFYYIGGGEKFIKGVFARFRPPQPPVVFRRREAGGWEAESFLDAEVVGYTPPTQSSLCARTSALRASVACAQSLLFPLKISIKKPLTVMYS